VKFRPVLGGKWYSYFGELHGLLSGLDERHPTHKRNSVSTSIRQNRRPADSGGLRFPRHRAWEEVTVWGSCGY
jgi:hypothetical protein